MSRSGSAHFGHFTIRRVCVLVPARMARTSQPLKMMGRSFTASLGMLGLLLPALRALLLALLLASYDGCCCGCGQRHECMKGVGTVTVPPPGAATESPVAFDVEARFAAMQSHLRPIHPPAGENKRGHWFTWHRGRPSSRFPGEPSHARPTTNRTAHAADVAEAQHTAAAYSSPR